MSLNAHAFKNWIVCTLVRCPLASCLRDNMALGDRLASRLVPLVATARAHKNHEA